MEVGLDMKQHILLVDDDWHLCRALQLGLVGMGYSVATAANAKDALRLFESQSFDIVVSDVVMPGPSGYWLANEIQACQPATAIIMMTASPDSPFFERRNGRRGQPAPEDLASAHTLPHILKPFLLSKLVELFPS
jgi:CheY-like chemotaxis protein